MTTLSGQDADDLLASLEHVASPAEMARRRAEAELRLTPDANGSVWYSLRERAAEKQASRDEDARRLAAGEVTPVELRVENSFFGTGRFIISHRGGSPLKKRPRR